jgi:bacillithiol biosynthesis cysteine-adding enzyme BshC
MSLRFVPAPLPAVPDGQPEGWRAQPPRAVPPDLAEALIADEPAAARNRERLFAGARAVTTGQQAALFTGPLYTIYKALSAAALAETLEARHGEPVVPLFWVAGDDHDFAEINHCDVLAADGRLTRIVLRERDAEAAMLPAYREPVGPEGAAALDALAAALPPSAFHDEVLALLRQAYQPAHSLAEAHARALAALLGPLGVVVVRGWAAGLKRAAAGVLLEAARQAASLDGDLAREADALRARGLSVPVAVGEGMSLLMLEGRLGRDRLRVDGDGRFTLRRSGEPVSLADLERVAAQEPERLSGNVLLRPVVEAAVFPTVAYVGGPGELAYLAQTGPVFGRLAVPRPARIPRVSGYLVEAKVDRVLGKYALEPADFARSEGELTSRIAREDLPAGAARALAAARAAVEERYAALRAEAGAIDATLERSVETTRNQVLVGLNQIEKKLVAALKRHNETAVRQLARVREQLHPGGRPQERVLSVVSFLARHGREVVALVAGAARTHARALLEAPSGRA